MIIVCLYVQICCFKECEIYFSFLFFSKKLLSNQWSSSYEHVIIILGLISLYTRHVKLVFSVCNVLLPMECTCNLFKGLFTKGVRQERECLDPSPPFVWCCPYSGTPLRTSTFIIRKTSYASISSQIITEVS